MLRLPNPNYMTKNWNNYFYTFSTHSTSITFYIFWNFSINSKHVQRFFSTFWCLWPPSMSSGEKNEKHSSLYTFLRFFYTFLTFVLFVLVHFGAHGHLPWVQVEKLKNTRVFTLFWKFLLHFLDICFWYIAVLVAIFPEFRWKNWKTPEFLHFFTVF